MKTDIAAQLLVNERQAAQLLGLSPSTLYLRRKSGDLPHIQVGRAVRYDPHALEEWVRRQSITVCPRSN